MKIKTIIALMALVSTSSAFALPFAAKDGIELSGSGGSANASITASASCSFVANTGFSLKAAKIYTSSDSNTQMLYAAATDPKVGTVSTAGYSSISIDGKLSNVGITAFGSGTVTNYVSVEGTEYTAATFKAPVSMSTASEDITLEYLAAASDTGFKTVGTVKAELTITCK